MPLLPIKKAKITRIALQVPRQGPSSGIMKQTPLLDGKNAHLWWSFSRNDKKHSHGMKVS
jgi:hypothetical protein